MGRLVFVHGINVRAPEGPGEHPYDETCRAIGYELFLKNIKWRIVKCRWGDDLGARLFAKGVSFPPERDKQLGELVGPDDPAKLWGVLFEDPTFELRALSSMPETEAEAMLPGAGRPKWVKDDPFTTTADPTGMGYHDSCPTPTSLTGVRAAAPRASPSPRFLPAR